jgi:hypothetical protein
MRSPSARSSVISGAAIGAAVIWGLAELLALQWSRFSERLRLRLRGRLRAI